MTANHQSDVTFGQVLKNRQFLALWLANLVSSFGDWLAFLSLFSLIAFRWHGTPSQVSGILIAFVTPLAVFGPVAGVFVDRWDLKRTMIASDLIRAVLAALLAFAPGVFHIYVLVFALSLVSSFFLPAQTVAIPRLVRKEELLVANALNVQTMNINKVISPAAAGLLVAWAGEKICFYIDSVSFIFSAAMISLLALSREPAAVGSAQRAIGKELLEGLRFIVRHRAILFLISSMVAAILALGAFDALIVVYVRDVLASQSGLFGAIISLVGVSTILGSLLIGKFGQRQPRLRLVVLGILALGLSVFILSAFGLVWVTLVCCLGFGLGAAGVLVPAQALMQEETPPEILGRVSSTSMSLITVAQLISFLAAGTIAGWVGIRNLYYLVAVMLVVIASWGLVYTRAGRALAAKVAQ